MAVRPTSRLKGHSRTPCFRDRSAATLVRRPTCDGGWYLFPIETILESGYNKSVVENSTFANNGDKGKPTERWGRKATGLTFDENHGSRVASEA
jgi:hypothetical protein